MGSGLKLLESFNHNDVAIMRQVIYNALRREIGQMALISECCIQLIDNAVTV